MTGIHWSETFGLCNFSCRDPIIEFQLLKIYLFLLLTVLDQEYQYLELLYLQWPPRHCRIGVLYHPQANKYKFHLCTSYKHFLLYSSLWALTGFKNKFVLWFFHSKFALLNPSLAYGDVTSSFRCAILLYSKISTGTSFSSVDWYKLPKIISRYYKYSPWEIRNQFKKLPVAMSNTTSPSSSCRTVHTMSSFGLVTVYQGSQDAQ